MVRVPEKFIAPGVLLLITGNHNNSHDLFAMIILQTERLVLRPYQLSDADFILRLVNEPSFHQYIGDRKVRTRDDAIAYINARLLPSYLNYGYGLYQVDLRNGTRVGMCGLVKRDAAEDPDVGFAFIPETWRRGYAFEAGTAVLQHARDLHLKRVLGITVPDNIASVKTLEKLGMRFLRADTSKETRETLSVYEIFL